MSNVLFTRVQHNPAFNVGGVRFTPANLFGGVREAGVRMGKADGANALAPAWCELRYSLDALPINNRIDSQSPDMGGVKYRRDGLTLGGLLNRFELEGVVSLSAALGDTGITETGLLAHSARNQHRVLVSRNGESRSH
jgi:hypothetical protein